MKYLQILFAVFIGCGLIMVNSDVLAARRHHTKDQTVNVENTISKKININEATAEQLMSLKGIGRARAMNIVQYRQQHGKFKSIDDLADVKRIGPKFLENLKKRNPGDIVVS